jgi:hypothetical protein
MYGQNHKIPFGTLYILQKKYKGFHFYFFLALNITVMIYIENINLNLNKQCIYIQMYIIKFILRTCLKVYHFLNAWNTAPQASQQGTTQQFTMLA